VPRCRAACALIVGNASDYSRQSQGAHSAYCGVNAILPSLCAPGHFRTVQGFPVPIAFRRPQWRNSRPLRRDKILTQTILNVEKSTVSRSAYKLTICGVKLNHVLPGGNSVVSSDDDPIRQEVVLDGLIYHISLSAEFGRYFASWTCMNCPLQDHSTMHCDTGDEAIAQARAILQDHHRRVHCDGPNDQPAFPRRG
jgi:hypothetical protein